MKLGVSTSHFLIITRPKIEVIWGFRLSGVERNDDLFLAYSYERAHRNVQKMSIFSNILEYS